MSTPEANTARSTLGAMKRMLKTRLMDHPPIRRAVLRRRAAQRRSNVAMFHTGRCGSTVLGGLLNQHPDITWASELFLSMRKRFGDRSVRDVLRESMYASGSAVYGFETKYLRGQQLRPEWIGMPLQEYVALLQEMGFSEFILLRRRNHLRKVVSAAIARERGAWHARSLPGAPLRVHLDIEKVTIGNQDFPLIPLFQEIDERYAMLRDLVRSDRVLELNYEDHVMNDPRVAYELICDFTGVKSARPEVRLAKTNPFPLRDCLSNHDEVCSALKGTEYAWMLSETETG
jgi:hypothetical protein